MGDFDVNIKHLMQSLFKGMISSQGPSVSSTMDAHFKNLFSDVVANSPSLNNLPIKPFSLEHINELNQPLSAF